jgi:kinesin family protein C2/C3
MSGIPSNRGVNFRTLSELFRLRDERKDDYEYKFTLSMKEIYNETIRDLIDPSTSDKGELKIRQSSTGIGMYIDGITERSVECEQDVIDLMELGNKNRSVSATQMNELSSRSHSLLTISVVGHNKITSMHLYGKVTLIDLAGSERLSRSQATGDQLKEAQAINSSLSALGNCIAALQKRQAHIPYRDSKLTYLLQDSLGGNAKTLLFVNVSPNDMDADETLCSLNFAARARQVELGTAVRRVVTDEQTADETQANAPAEGGDAPATPAKKAAAAAAPSSAVKKVAATKVSAASAATVVKKVAAPKPAAAAAAAPVRKSSVVAPSSAKK